MLLNTHIPVSYILNKIKYDVLSVMVVSTLILVVTHSYASLLPEIPVTIAVFLGTAISILLSFKLNQSYDRWWEARKIWGSIVNDSRTLALQLQGFLKNGGEVVLKRVVNRQIAWNYAFGRSLRGLDPMAGLEEYVSPDEFADVLTHDNKALALLHFHNRDFKLLREQGLLDGFGHIQLDNTLQRLCDSMGRAERIKSTVFPVTYRKFLHYLIYLFVIILSISLTDIEGYFELPVLLVISSAFFLLEKSATHMQDPFENRPTDTAVTSIARKIEINLKQLIKDPKVPAPLEADDFYLN